MEEADAALAEFEEVYAEEWQIGMAGMYAWRGESDLAFKWLRKTLKENPDMGIYWTYDQFLNTLHDDPRWAAFISNWDVVIE